MVTKRPMLSDLAREAAVSRSTASRALRNLPGVSPQVKARVLRAARKLNYIPNEMARSLSLGRTNLIGFVTPPIMRTTPHYPSVNRLESLAKTDGKRLVHLSYEQAEWETLPTMVLEQHLEGVLLVPDTPWEITTKIAKTLSNLGIPLVVVEAPAWDGLDCVSFDRAYGVRLLLDHGREKGRQKVAVIGMAKDYNHLTDSPKYRSLESELNTRGMELTEVICFQTEAALGTELYRAAYNAMTTALGNSFSADFLMGTNDVIATAAMNSLFAHGYRVPEDIIVTGYDNNDAAFYARPPLTTIKAPLEEMVEFAWSLLKRRLAGESGEPKSVTLQPSLIVRASTEN